MTTEMSKNSRCTRCGSLNIDSVLGNGTTIPNGYVCRGCGLRWYLTNDVQPKEEKKLEPAKLLTVEERALAQLIEIAEHPGNDLLARIEACKVILGRSCK